MLVDFCIPVRNEEQILEVNLGRLREFLIGRTWPFVWRVIVIVNGSNDSSATIAQSWAMRDSRLLSLVLAGGGKGLALRAGFKASPADILVFMDVDLAVSLDNLADLLSPLLHNQADLVFGSRLLPGSDTDRSFLRSLTSRGYNLLSRLILKHAFSDLQCGFKALRREVFAKIEPSLEDNQWFFDTELLILAQRSGYRLLEIPVSWRENRYEKRASKIKPLQDSYRFIRKLLIFQRRLRRRQLI